MTRSDAVFIEGVADHALAIDLRSVIRISGREARLGIPNHKHDSDRHRAGRSIWSANARAQALDTTEFRVHDVPPCHSSCGIAGRSKNSAARPHRPMTGPDRDLFPNQSSACYAVQAKAALILANSINSEVGCSSCRWCAKARAPA